MGAPLTPVAEESEEPPPVEEAIHMARWCGETRGTKKSKMEEERSRGTDHTCEYYKEGFCTPPELEAPQNKANHCKQEKNKAQIKV